MIKRALASNDDILYRYHHSHHYHYHPSLLSWKNYIKVQFYILTLLVQ